MKIKHLPWILAATTVILFASGYTLMTPTGAPAAKTGSPGDGSNCTECHGGTATTTAGQITSNIPASGYVPGTTYQITATNPLTGSGKMGFEVSPQNVAGTQLGTLVAGSGSKLVGGTKYVTHSNANTTTNTWTFSWIAPVAGTGQVTFYGAFARNKPGPVTKSTLVVEEAASAPGAAGAITGPATVCKNNTESYSIAAVSGATGYVWTVPAGVTIQSGQGTTSVSVLFGTSAVSGNISVYGTNAAGNGAASNKMLTVNTVPATPAIPDGPSLVNVQNTPNSNYSTTTTADSFIWELSPANAGSISGTSATAAVTWSNSYIGNAEVRVKGVNPCGEGAWSLVKFTQVINTTGVDELTAGIKVITGGANNQTAIVMNTEVREAKLMILDITGRVMLNTTIPGTGTYKINQQLKSGVYIVTVKAGSSVLNQKIFIN
jgi:hypothetical protein